MRASTVKSFAGTSRFRVLAKLGAGSMGEVFSVFDRDRGLHLALKHLHRADPRDLARFKGEFRVLRDIQHPNLVSLGELIEADGEWYLTMELVDGHDLLSFVRRTDSRKAKREEKAEEETAEATAQAGSSGLTTTTDPEVTVADLPTGDTTPIGPVRETGDLPAAPKPALHLPAQPRPPQYDEARLRDAFRQLAAGLGALHRAGKIHRDIKPSNILVGRDHRVVILDFGVAAELEHADDDRGTMIGTISHMSPEQSRGETASEASDWYAVGTLLFQALTGHLPFGGNLDMVLASKRVAEAPSPEFFTEDLPSDLVQLCAQLLARDPKARGTRQEILAAFGVDPSREWVAVAPLDMRGAGRFIGRQHEMAVLAEAFEDMRSGAAVAISMHGSSGVGKTALVERFLAELRLEREKVVVLRGRCHERESVLFKAVDGVVDDLRRFLARVRKTKLEDLVPDDARDLAALFPTLAAIPEIGEPVAAEDESRPPQEIADAAVAALRRLLCQVSRRRSLVLVIDDLQWADSDSLALLARVMERPGAPQCLLLLVEWSVAGERLVADRVTRNAVSLPVDRLPASDAMDLARSLLESNRDVAADTLEPLVADADGHPLFIRELVEHLRDRGASSVSSLQLDQALLHRVSRLDAPARVLLECVAVAGGPLPQGVVAKAAGLTPAAFAAHSMTLQRGRLVRIAGVRRQDDIEPYHARIAEAIYANLAADDRVALHGRIAARLEDVGALPDILLEHFEGAGMPDRASHYAEAAGRRAARALAFDRAVELFRRADALTDHPPAKSRELRVAIGEALVNAGRPGDAARTFLEAAAEAAPNSDERLELNRRAAEQFLMGGYLDEGLAATRAVLAAVGRRLPATPGRTLLALVWAEIGLRLRAMRWQSRSPSAIEQRHLTAIDVCWSVGAGLSMVDAIRGALFAVRGPGLSLRHGESFRIARALCAAAVAESSQGNARQASRLIAASARAAEEHGTSLARYYPCVAEATHAFLHHNDWPSAFAGAEEARRLWREARKGAGWEADVADQIACWSLDNMGEIPRLRERVPPRIRAAQRAGNRFIEIGYRCYFYVLHVMGDTPDLGIADVQDAIASWLPGSDIYGNQHYWATRSLGFLHLYRGDVEEGGRALEPLWQRLDKSLLRRIPLMCTESTWVRGCLAVRRAALAIAAGRASEAKPHLHQARKSIRILSRIGQPSADQARPTIEAGLARLLGDDEQAIAYLRAAESLEGPASMSLIKLSARWRLGVAIGGGEGADLVQSAEAGLRERGAVNPQRVVATVTPGWDPPD